MVVGGGRDHHPSSSPEGLGGLLALGAKNIGGKEMSALRNFINCWPIFFINVGVTHDRGAEEPVPDSRRLKRADI